MLLNEEQKASLAARIIAKAQRLLGVWGVERRDQDTGFVHQECRAPPFLMVQHQRQQLAGGAIKTNGLDLWVIEDEKARRALSAHYVPFRVNYFDHAGKAEWIERFLALPEQPDNAPSE